MKLSTKKLDKHEITQRPSYQSQIHPLEIP